MGLPLAAACEDMCVALLSLQGSGQSGTAKSEPYKGSLLLHLWRSPAGQGKCKQLSFVKAVIQDLCRLHQHSPISLLLPTRLSALLGNSLKMLNGKGSETKRAIQNQTTNAVLVSGTDSPLTFAWESSAPWL